MALGRGGWGLSNDRFFFSIEIYGALFMVYSTRRKPRMHHFQAGEKAPINRTSEPVLRWRGCSVSPGPGEPVQPMRTLPSSLLQF